MSSSKETTQKTLSRIEETLEALCGEVAAIRGKVEALEGAQSGRMSTQEIIDFLDGYRAAEAMAATAVGAWVAVSDTPCLRGGLRSKAEALAHERLTQKPLSAVNRGFLARALAQPEG